MEVVIFDSRVVRAIRDEVRIIVVVCFVFGSWLRILLRGCRILQMNVFWDKSVIIAKGEVRPSWRTHSSCQIQTS